MTFPETEPHRRFTTLHATFRRWDHRDSRHAVRVGRTTDRDMVSLQWERPGRDEPDVSRTIRVWTHQPHRIRVEEAANGSLTALQVRDGDLWRIWSATDGEYAGRGQTDPRTPTVALLTEPWHLLESLQVISCGRGARAGRLTRVLTARPRDRAAGGQIFSLELDTEFGTLLRSAVIRGGLTTSVSEATLIDYDVDIDPTLFALDSPPKRFARDA